MSKKEKEKVIFQKLQEYYDAYSGTKAEELLKKTEAALQEIEDGQILDKEIKGKLDQKTKKVYEHKRKMSEDVRIKNITADSVKYDCYENLEKMGYDRLENHVLTNTSQKKYL